MNASAPPARLYSENQSPVSPASPFETEVGRRRTFAIISHPDAGKTTLTEKLLLYSGAIEQAGSVRARKNQRSATSDWMAMERDRGISVTSTALQFEYRGHIFNLLDTPGHQDFSEDTYRTLMAVDSAIMVLDSAKGIEPQTRKLFEVCRSRNLPILTFINKLDMPGREPLALLDEIERVLHMTASPMNWPVGAGSLFQGVYNLAQRDVLMFQRHAKGSLRAHTQTTTIDDPALEAILGPHRMEQFREEVALLSDADYAFNHAAFLRGEATPVFFGSAINNFGVEPFLEALIGLAPSPQAMDSLGGPVDPTSAHFSGIVFKMQANMDPQHRDSMAFLRVCSGRFEKDMLVYHPRLKRNIRMARPHRLFAQERETVQEAFAGDVIGLSNPGLFLIGDTIYADKPVQFPPIPRFHPECFAKLTNLTINKSKQFKSGLKQLEEEGVVQVLYADNYARHEPILAAVGDLQFDVVVARLALEYGVETQPQRLPYTSACWINRDDPAFASVIWPSAVLRATDAFDRFVTLFPSPWELSYLAKQNPRLVLRDVAGNPMTHLSS